MTTMLSKATSWSDVRDLVNDQHKLNFDFFANPSMIRMGDDGTVCAIDNEKHVHELGFTDIGLQQFATKVGIPSQYASKLATIDKELLASNFNTMLKMNVDPNKDLLVRATNKPSGPCMRAMLSDRYGILDNHEFVGAVADAFVATGLDQSVKIEDLHLGDRSFHIRLTDEHGKKDAMTAAKEWEQSTGHYLMSSRGMAHDFLYPMLHLSNSEIGASSVKLEGGVYRVVCTNGMVAPANIDNSFKRRHFGFTQNELTAYVVEKAQGILRNAQAFTGDFIDAQFTEIKEPEDTIERLIAKHRITKANEKSIRSELGLTTGGWPKTDRLIGTGTAITAYDMANAITATARDLKDYDARVDLERIAATFVTHKN